MSADSNVAQIDNFEGLFGIRLNEEEVNDKEIKEALFYIRENKAPGPEVQMDTLQCSTKKACPVVGVHVCMDVNEFFCQCEIAWGNECHSYYTCP